MCGTQRILLTTVSVSANGSTGFVAVCQPQFNGFANVWVDRPDAQEIVASALFDINIRFSLEECIDMPKQVVSTVR